MELFDKKIKSEAAKRSQSKFKLSLMIWKKHPHPHPKKKKKKWRSKNYSSFPEIPQGCSHPELAPQKSQKNTDLSQLCHRRADSEFRG